MRMKVLVAQLCPTLCDPMNCSPPGSPVHGILQARVLEWVAIPFSRVSSQLKDQTQANFLPSEPWKDQHKLIPLSSPREKIH